MLLVLWIERPLEFRLRNLIATVVFYFYAIPVGLGGGREGGAAENSFNSVTKRHFDCVVGYGGKE